MIDRFFKSLFHVLVLLGVSLILTGTDACQEDYQLGSQSEVDDESDDETVNATQTAAAVATQTAAAVATQTAEAVATQTAAAAATQTAAPLATETAQAIATETAEAAESPEPGITETEDLSAASLLKSLASLAPEKKADASKTPLPVVVGSGGSASGNNRNWLGNIYTDKPDKNLDSDNDGFTNLLERDLGLDADDSFSFPTKLVTHISVRLENYESLKALYLADPVDGSPDSDDDQLSDDLELAIGSNPSQADSDNDGVLDWKEFEIGSDPIVSEALR